MNNDDFWAQQQLAKNPLQMATRIIELEKNIARAIDPRRRSALINKLKACVDKSLINAEEAQNEAVDLLLAYIKDDEISELYNKVVWS